MRRAILLVAGMAALGCGPSAPPEPFFGDWKATAAFAPAGSSAAPAGESTLAVGTAVRLSARAASHGTRRCSGPTYTRRWLAPSTFREAYHVAPDSLGLPEGPVEFVDVTCADGSLDAAATLVVRPDGTLLTVRDGVFHVLTRQ